MAGLGNVLMTIATGFGGKAVINNLTAKGPQAPVLPPPPPPVNVVAAVKPRNNKRGTGSDPSLLTGPLGVTAPPVVAPKSLLGS